MDYLPIFYQLRQRTCLVVGGGAVAARKVALLRKASADVVIVSPELCDELARLKSKGSIRHIERTYESGDLLNEWPEGLRPEAIKRIDFYASGHEYDVMLNEVALIATLPDDSPGTP